MADDTLCKYHYCFDREAETKAWRGLVSDLTRTTPKYYIWIVIPLLPESKNVCLSYLLPWLLTEARMNLERGCYWDLPGGQWKRKLMEGVARLMGSTKEAKSRKVGEAGGWATGLKSAGRTRANAGPQRLSAGCPQSPRGCHHLPRTTVSKCQQHCLPSHSSAFLPNIPFTNNASWKTQVWKSCGAWCGRRCSQT